MLRGAILAMFALVAMGAAHAQTLHPLPRQPVGLAWPTQQWAEAPLPSDVDSATLDLAITNAFASSDGPMGETRAVLVVQSGRIVFERYNDGYTRDTRLVSWSMGKSITHALVGAAVLQNRVNIDTPMGNPHWPANDRRARISWRTFMQFTDGLDYTESAPEVVHAGNARMLFGDGRMDVAAWAAARPLIHDPGTHWNYSSGTTMLIADALTRVIVPNPQNVSDRRTRMLTWMRASLFDHIGMHPVVEFDPQGAFYGSSLFWATARDYARFGYLYLRNGMWDRTRVLPEGWVDFARAHGPAHNTDTYGAQFWLTPTQGPGTPRSLITDNAMSDAFSAQGYEGQLIVIVPSKDLIMVRLGRMPNDTTEAWNALGDWSTQVIGAFGRRRG